MTELSSQEIRSGLGMHRVLEPEGALPQPAWKLDNTPLRQPGETLVEVEALHIDSASFTQIAQACRQDTERMKAHIPDIVSRRGKMHNPVTGSGGVLIGKVRELDDVYAQKFGLAIGDTIISLTSLSWLPLHLVHISAVYLDRCEVEVKGQAVFFRSNPLAKLPQDIPRASAVAALDVAGAPSRVLSLVQSPQRVIVLGAGGTAGLLTLCALRQRMKQEGEIIAIEFSERALQDIAALNVANTIVLGDATRPLELIDRLQDKFGGEEYLADLSINVVNVPGTEFATILLTKPTGRILFFSMATSFTTAALGAEGIASQVEMHIGNGYMPDHGTVALQLLRDYPQLSAVFARRFEINNLPEDKPV